MHSERQENFLALLDSKYFVFDKITIVVGVVAVVGIATVGT